MFRPYPTLYVFPVAGKSRCPGWYSPSSYLFLYLTTTIFYSTKTSSFLVSFHCNKNNNRTGGVIIRVLASIWVDCEFEPRSGQAEHLTIKLIFVASPLRMQSKGVRANTCWLDMKKGVQVERHVCSRTVLLVSQHYKYQIKRVSLVQRLHNHYFIEYNLFSTRYS